MAALSEVTICRRGVSTITRRARLGSPAAEPGAGRGPRRAGAPTPRPPHL